MKSRVLFICIGNSIRSQMAEAFARKYGSDVIEPSSAGLAPAPGIAEFTVKVLEQRNISMEGQFPKDLTVIDVREMDLIVNISGQRLHLKSNTPVLEWAVKDPVGQKEPAFQACAQDLENRVMQLILQLRQQKRAKTASGR